MSHNLIILALLPVIVLLAFVYFKDRIDKEPPQQLIKAILAGVFCALPAIILEGILSSFTPSSDTPILSGLFQGFVVAGFSEELCKLVMLYLIIWNSKHFDEYFDGIVYATFVSLGFAGLENILYVFNQADYAAALTTGSMRAILSVPGHFLFAVVMGYYFALAKFQPRNRFSNILKALLFPTLLHGTFDSLLMIPEGFASNQGIISTILFVIFLWFDYKLWKIGTRKLRHLQQLSQEQAHSNPDFGENTSSSSSSNTPDDPFSNIHWDV